MTPLPVATQAEIARLSQEGLGASEIARRLGVSRGSALRYGAPRLDGQGLPFGNTPQGAAKIPPPAWNADQPPPPPRRLEFRPGYHDHTFRAFAQPLAFDGWTVERIRNAISMHDIGIFIESSMLMVACRRFGPVFAALEQAIAPVLALPRQVLGGTRGFSRIAAEEVTSMLAPRQGLLPSPYFPPTLWGALAIERRLMGFAVLQHVYGEADPVTGVRPLYSRRWPTWAVNYYPARRTFVALTNDGPVDIINGDGKFTLIADSEEPHLDGAIRALGLEVLAGVISDQALASYIDRYGNPKLWATMPENTATRSEAGDAFFDALATIQGPDGYGALPHGSTLEWAQLSAAQSTMFRDADEKVTRRCTSIILGTDGTVSKGTGGVYLSPTFEGVARTIVDRMLQSIVRGVNLGCVAPYLALNYEATIAETRGWVEPVLSIPLPDPNADARRAAYAQRSKERTEILVAERAAGLDVTQERVDQVSAELGLQAILLSATTVQASRIELAPTDIAKVVRVDEARASQGLAPIGDTRGNLMISELDAGAPVLPVDGEAAPPPEAPRPPPEAEPEEEPTPAAEEEPADDSAGPIGDAEPEDV